MLDPKTNPLYDLTQPFEIGRLAEQQLIRFIEMRTGQIDAPTLAALRRSLELLAETRCILNELQREIDGPGAIAAPDRGSFHADCVARGSRSN